jgi:hypothetical protein
MQNWPDLFEKISPGMDARGLVSGTDTDLLILGNHKFETSTFAQTNTRDARKKWLFWSE